VDNNYCFVNFKYAEGYETSHIILNILNMPKDSQNICNELKPTVVCRGCKMHFAPPQHVSKVLIPLQNTISNTTRWLCHFFLGQNQPQEVTENQRDMQNAVQCFTIASGEQIDHRKNTNFA